MEDYELLQKAVTWAQQKGFSNIKANLEAYDAPAQFTKPGEDQPYIPDISGVRLGGKSYFELSLKTDESNRRISKWKLLSTLAAMKHGKLFLLAPKGHKAFTDKIVKKHNITATVVSI